MRFRIPALLPATALFLVSSLPFAEGGSAVITLVMPPPGGEGYSALQAGAAMAQGSPSLFYNPALLANLEKSTGSQLFYAHSRQRLLPILRFPGLNQEFWSMAAVLPDPGSGTDMGIGFFRNRVNFGYNSVTDASGNEIGLAHSEETVYGAGIGVRLGMPISLGATIKFIDSDLAPELPGPNTAYGWAFDIGAVADPRLEPAPELGWPALALTPSLAMVAKNLGPDIFYVEAYQKDPIPTTYTAAYGAKLEVADMLELEAGADLDHEWTHRSEDWDQVRVLGYAGYILGFRWGEAWLDDPTGRRIEKHIFRAFEINFRHIHRIFRRLALGDFMSPSREMERGYAFPAVQALGIPFRANPRLEVGFRKIKDRVGLRDKQESRYYLGFSI